ncbi:MAG: DUF2530 domain-containing protein [Candidatus Nanopelagicales bacterium]|jgi:hypothetical protein
MGNSADSLNEFESGATNQRSGKELAPLEVNGITAVTVGTGVWSVATLVMVLMRDQLETSGRGNWIAIGVCGIILGLLGMRYTKRRAARIERANKSS